METRHHVVLETPREDVKFTGPEELNDREGRCDKEHSNYNRCEE
jgi:hypothetical protein